MTIESPEHYLDAECLNDNHELRTLPPNPSVLRFDSFRITFVCWASQISNPKFACMSDNKNVRGEKDSRPIAHSEKWEIDYLIDQTGATRKEIAEAIKKVGNDKDKVEEYLRNQRIF